MTKEQIEKIEKKAKEIANKYAALGFKCSYSHELYELYEAAMDMACWLFSHQWVSVEDELPKLSKIVLIRNKDGKIARATYGIVGRFDNGNTIEYVNGWILNDVGVRMGESDVTHWMPIPPLAEEGGEKK